MFNQIRASQIDDGTDTLIKPNAVEAEADQGDHDRFSHYVKKDEIVASSVEGTPLVALCGKVWIPSRDPKKYPICPECKDIYESLEN